MDKSTEVLKIANQFWFTCCLHHILSHFGITVKQMQLHDLRKNLIISERINLFVAANKLSPTTNSLFLISKSNVEMS